MEPTLMNPSARELKLTKIPSLPPVTSQFPSLTARRHAWVNANVSRAPAQEAVVHRNVKVDMTLMLADATLSMPMMLFLLIATPDVATSSRRVETRNNPATSTTQRRMLRIRSTSRSRRPLLTSWVKSSRTFSNRVSPTASSLSEDQAPWLPQALS